MAAQWDSEYSTLLRDMSQVTVNPSEGDEVELSQEGSHFTDGALTKSSNPQPTFTSGAVPRQRDSSSSAEESEKQQMKSQRMTESSRGNETPHNTGNIKETVTAYTDNFARSLTERSMQMQEEEMTKAVYRCQDLRLSEFPTFEGDEVHQFFENLETLFLIKAVPQQLQQRILTILLRGEAKLWWKTIGGSIQPMSYNVLKEAIIAAFPERVKKLQACRNFYTEQQERDIKPTYFVLQKFDEAATIGIQFTEYQMIQHIIERMEPKIREYLEIRDPISKLQLFELIRKYEARYPSVQSPAMNQEVFRENREVRQWQGPQRAQGNYEQRREWPEDRNTRHQPQQHGHWNPQHRWRPTNNQERRNEQHETRDATVNLN